MPYEQWHHCAFLSHASTRLTFYIYQMMLCSSVFCSIRTQWLLGTFFGLALLVIILETHCCQAVKLKCRVVLGAPTRIVLTSPRQSEGLLLMLFSIQRALSSRRGGGIYCLKNNVLCVKFLYWKTMHFALRCYIKRAWHYALHFNIKKIHFSLHLYTYNLSCSTDT